MSNTTTKALAEKVKEKVKEQQLTAEQSPPAPKEEEAPPFGGGQLKGLLVDPSSEATQALQGYDDNGFSKSRTYGCSLYLPLQKYCSTLLQDEDPVSRMVGFAHLGDRFMVYSPQEQKDHPYSEAEEAVYYAAREVAASLFKQGALRPLAFPKVTVLGHQNTEVLPGRYVPSTGYSKASSLTEFKRYMDNPENWLWATRQKMTALKARIDAGEAAPVPGYQPFAQNS